MFGFADIWIDLAYLGCILSALLCVLYGLRHWNTDDEMPAAVHPSGESNDFEETV